MKNQQDQSAPITVTLSGATSALVRWYCAITHQFEREAVDGALFGTLERAKDAHEGAPGMDEAFNWLLEDVVCAMKRVDHDEIPGLPVHLNGKAAELLHRYLAIAGEVGAKKDPRDAVSGTVLYALGQALTNYEKDQSGIKKAKSKSRYFDDAWGYVEEKVDEACFRRVDEEAQHRRKLNACRAHGKKQDAQPSEAEAFPLSPEHLQTLADMATGAPRPFILQAIVENTLRAAAEDPANWDSITEDALTLFKAAGGKEVQQP
jgi:hypothetical protein